MLLRCILLLCSCWSRVSAPAAASPDVLSARLREAIATGGTYAADVLLDPSGQSRCDYDLLTGQWTPYEPAWHTGQIILGLVEAHKITGDPHLLQRARDAGNWWISLEITDHPKLKGMVRAIHGAGINNIIFATVSDGTAGLFALSRLTGDPRYADVSTRAGAWMLRHLYVPEQGVFYDAVDPDSGEVLTERSPFWPEKKQQVLTDVARPNNEGSLYKDMYLHTGDTRYREVFLAVCDSLVAKQGPEGLWMEFTPNDASRGRLHPRFNLWYAESLLEGYELTRDPRYLAAARRTLVFYTKLPEEERHDLLREFPEWNRDGELALRIHGRLCGPALAAPDPAGCGRGIRATARAFTPVGPGESLSCDPPRSQSRRGLLQPANQRPRTAPAAAPP
jgi:hypothetical protein